MNEMNLEGDTQLMPAHHIDLINKHSPQSIAMASTEDATSLDSSSNSVDALDDEIKSLKEELANLRKTVKIECSTALSSQSIQKALRSRSKHKSRSKSKSRSNASSLSDFPSTSTSTSSNSKLSNLSALQQAHAQQCTYRISASVTAFKVRDPDPNAVDGGHVLGLRFEVMVRGQFLKPYYVMLNRPFFNSTFLRVHRHTVPPAIPLSGLAARHLPALKPESEVSPTQDLEMFVRTLRKEIMRYHNRLGVSADLRRSVGLLDKDGIVSADSIVDVSIADVEAKQIRLTWADERDGRIVIDDDGNVVKFIVFNGETRDWQTTKEFFGEHEHVHDIVKMMEEHVAE